MTTNAPSGFKATSGKIFSTSNHIFVYKNSEEAIEMNKQYVPKSFDNAYKYILKNPDDNPENWKFENFYDNFAQQNNYKNFKEMKKRSYKGAFFRIKANRKAKFSKKSKRKKKKCLEKNAKLWYDNSMW